VVGFLDGGAVAAAVRALRDFLAKSSRGVGGLGSAGRRGGFCQRRRLDATR
jgi:hypothetical protein